MRNLKLFMAALALTGWGNFVLAQTDVTSNLTNPSFEYSASGTVSTAKALTSGGTYYGWTLPSLGTNYVNISIGDASNCNGQAFGIPTAKDGSYYYFERRGWNSSISADATMSTTLNNLPVGHYTLTMAYKGLDSWDKDHTSKGSYLKLIAATGNEELAFIQTPEFEAVNGNNAGANKFKGDANWKEVSLTFDVATAGDVTLSIIHHLVGGVRTDVVIDDLKLMWTAPEAAAHAAALESAKYSLNGYIKKATALNGVLADETLATAIQTAQGIYDAADDYTEDYQNTVDASSTLNTAITTALSGATAVSLTNANFDTTPNNTLNSDNTTTFGGTLSTATSNPENTKDMSANTGDHGYLYDVTGWTQYSKFNSTASQGTTSEYGTAMPANGWSTNSTTPPSTDMFGGSKGAALHLSAGWGDQARYQQTINELPSGRYVFYYEVINQYSNTGIASNFTGVSGAAGDFYGTTNGFVFSNLNNAAQGEWIAQAFEFDVAKTTNINFNVGVTTSTGGSGNGAKLWFDNVLVYRIGEVVVTDADANAILENVAKLDGKAYNTTEKNDLAAKKSVFENNKTLDNYNALSAALVTAQNSVAVYEALNTAITNVEGWTSDKKAVTDPIRSKYTNGEYNDETKAENIYAEYQVAELAALVNANADDYTSAIINPSFETNDMTGWSAESRNDTGVKANSNGTYTTSNVDGDYLFNSWGGTAENNVYQTIKSLPAGTYTLTALVAGFNGEELVIAANETTNKVTVTGDKTVGYTAAVEFTLSDAADVVIKVSNTKSQESSDASFIKADNFKLTKGSLTTRDYTTLAAAIEVAETYTLGFQNGEYAPYKNVDAVKALAAAKAVDQNVPMLATQLVDIVSNLTNATWTANTEEVNAFYDGTFAIQPEHTTGPTALDGWNNPDGIRQLIKNTTTYAGLNSATDKAAVFAWGGTTLEYGKTEGYTMPLAAHTIYELTFKTCGWSDGDLGYVEVTILNSSNEGLSQKTSATATKRITDENPWNEFKAIFETGEAGNYTFGMWTSKHTTFTDLVLKKAVADNITISEGATAAPTASKYANVTLERGFNKGWNAVCLPFATPAFDGAEIAEFDGEEANDENVTLKFKKVTAFEANKPYLVYFPAAVTSGKKFEGVAVTPAEVKAEGTAFDFMGTYTVQNIAAGDYVVSGGALKKASDAISLKPTRTYFTPKTTSPARIAGFTIDGNVVTGISTIFTDEANTTEGIYNLQGQKVNGKAQKGIYIVNGKKVIK